MTAITSFQFAWPGKDGVNRKYRIDMPDTSGMIVLPDGTRLMVERCAVRALTFEESQQPSTISALLAESLPWMR